MSKAIRLYDFLKEARSRKVDLTGCFIQGSKILFKFGNLVEGKVWVTHGRNQKLIDSLIDGMYISKIELSDPKGRLRGKNTGIVIHASQKR